MKCPRCGKNMVMKPPTVIYLTYPAQYDEIWWCKCGETVNNGRVYEKTPEQMLREKWDKLNP